MQVLTSLSGLQFSAASAGFAPTNSADVSAIASAYQVVSATATQLYAGTAYLTSVNGAPVSASRAGQAANASLASSAYYDGTGRLISALPDSAAVSAIASSYAESAASGKLDSSAFNSADFYSTSNPSSFITGVDLSPYQTTAGMSGYVPTSLSSDFQQVTGMSSYALSADVSATVDLVGTQSANWGGSALQLSAGPGVKLEKSGNVLVAGLDETVLWSGEKTSLSAITLSESYTNFDRVRFYWKPWSDDVAWRVSEIPSFALVFTLDAGWASNGGSAAGKALFVYSISSNGTNFSQIQGNFQNITGGSWASSVYCTVNKVVGVSRTAGF